VEGETLGAMEFIVRDSSDPSPRDPLLSPSLELSVREGVASSAMSASGEGFASACAVYLKATPLQIGFLATLPMFLGAISQMAVLPVLGRIRNRRLILQTGSLLQALVWAVTASVLLIAPIQSSTVWFFVTLVCLSTMVGLGIAPVWSSLMGDLIPGETRGEFFGLRSGRMGVTTVLVMLLGGLILNFFHYFGADWLGFSFLFLAAASARFYSAELLGKHDNPELVVKDEDYFSFIQFLRKLPSSNFARFVLFTGLLNIGFAVSGPYFTIFMLRDLSLSYWQFTLLGAASAAAQFITMKHWGRLVDRFGSRQVMGSCAGGIVISPLLWLVHSNIWYLLVVQLYSGVVWAGYALATGSFLFDAVTPGKRARCAAYHGMMNATGNLIGGYIGGVIYTLLEHTEIRAIGLWTVPSNLLFLFVISAFFRLLCVVIFLRLFREVRPVEPASHERLLYEIATLRPFAGISWSFFRRDK
jgi:MFS family permease